jgi:hypothetical protein
MLRPKVAVLPDSANEAGDGTRADGHLAKNANVTLRLRGDGPLCRVEDSAGEQVSTASSGLRPLR